MDLSYEDVQNILKIIDGSSLEERAARSPLAHGVPDGEGEE